MSGSGLTASVLAQALQSAAIVTSPRNTQAQLKHFELLALSDALAFLVLVLDDGTVRQERLLLDTPTTQEELSRIAARFNARFPCCYRSGGSQASRAGKQCT